MKKKVSKSILTLFLSFLMVLSIIMSAGTQIAFAAGDDDVVPDLNLRASINDNKFNKWKDEEKHDPISKAQMESISGNVGVRNKPVTTLEGLQYAKKITLLRLINTGIDISELSLVKDHPNLSELILESNSHDNISILKEFKNLKKLNIKENKIFDLSPLKDLNITEIDATEQTPEIKVNSKTFENPIINKDGSKATITPNENISVDENGNITIVNFDNLKNNDIVVTGFSGSGEGINFNGHVTFKIVKEDVPLVEHNISIKEIEGANIITTPSEKAEVGTKVIINVEVTDNKKVLDKILINGNEISENSFIMPNEDVVVTATLKDKVIVTKNISITQIEGATISTTPAEKAEEGSTVTVNVKVNDDKKVLDKVVVDGKEISGNTFTMPEKDVVVSAKLKDKPVKMYSVKFANKPTGIKSWNTLDNYKFPAGTLVKVEIVMYFPEHYTYTHLNLKNLTTGEITSILEPKETVNKPYANKLNIAYIHEFVMPESDVEISMRNVEARIFIEKVNGKNATVTTTPEGSQINGQPVKINVADPDNKLIKIEVTDGKGNPVALSNDNVFKVPLKEFVNIKAIFAEDDEPIVERNINIEQIQGANITTNPSEKAPKDTDVKISIDISDSKKELDRFIVKDSDNNVIEVTNDTFKMPDKDVTVTAVLKDKVDETPENEYKISVYQGIASKYRAKAGETITVSTVLPSGKLERWSGNVNFANLYNRTTTFIMPAKDVSITAVERLNTKEVTEYYYEESPTQETRYEKVRSVENIDLVSKFVIGSNEYVKTLNGVTTTVKMDVAPFIQNDRTMLSLRFVGEALGFNVTWEEETRTAVLKNKEYTIRVQIDSEVFTVNGKEYKFDSKPVIKNDRTMLSISNLGLALGLVRDKNIIWEESTKTVIVKTKISVPFEKEVAVYTTPRRERKSYTETITEPKTVFNELQVLKNQLRSLINDAKRIDLSNVSTELAEAFRKVINNSERIFLNPISTIEDLKEGITSLRVAMDKLNETPIDPEEPGEESEIRKELRALVEEAKKIDRNLYTKESLKNLDDAVTKAEEILADSTLDDKTVETSVENLKLALKNLVIDESEVRRELRGLVGEAKEVNRDLYTEGSLKKLDDAVTKAEETLADSTLNDKTVDISVEILKLALMNLVKKDEASLKQFTIIEPHGLLNSPFAFAEMAGLDGLNTNLRVFIDGVELQSHKYQPDPGFYLGKSNQSNRKAIYLTAGTFKEVGEYKVKLVADGYATKEFTIEMEKFAPVLYFDHGTITTGVDLVVKWHPGNVEDLKPIYMTNDLVVKVNGNKVDYNIPIHKQSFTISKKHFPENGVYNIVVEREGFEDVDLKLNVSDINSVDIVSSATTEYNIKDEYTVGAGKDGYINYRFVKSKVTFEDNTTTKLEILDFNSWGIKITPKDGYVFKDEDVGEFPIIITKDKKELGRKIVTVKPRQ